MGPMAAHATLPGLTSLDGIVGSLAGVKFTEGSHPLRVWESRALEALSSDLAAVKVTGGSPPHACLGDLLMLNRPVSTAWSSRGLTRPRLRLSGSWVPSPLVGLWVAALLGSSGPLPFFH